MNGAGWRVRAGREADLADVIAVERAAKEAPHWSEAVYLAIVRTQGIRPREDGGGQRGLIVVEDNAGRVVGFAVGMVLGAQTDCLASLENVAVEMRVRRKGVGRALCEAVAEWCREQGARSLELEVRAGSTGAITLYERLGFVVAGRRRAYYELPTEDAVLMRMELDT